MNDNKVQFNIQRVYLKDLSFESPMTPDIFTNLSSSPKVGFNFESNIKGNTAGVIIGDRAYNYRDNFPYVYDLSNAWKKFSGLPFVFACWVSNKPLDPSFKKAFSSRTCCDFTCSKRDRNF